MVINQKKHTILLGLFVWTTVFITKLFFTPEITIRGDEYEKWYEVRRVVNGFGLTRFDHHTARFGMMWPAYIFQTVFGTKPMVYHLMMSSVFAGVGLLSFLITKYVTRSNLLAAITVTLVCSVLLYIRMSSQFLPSGFVIFYLFLTLWLVTKFIENPRATWILFIGTSFFFAYASKVTSLFFLPALIIFFWAAYGRRVTIIFLSCLATLYFFEQLLNWYLLGEFHFFSRLEMMSFHNAVMEKRTYEWKDIYLRWLQLPKAQLLFLSASILVSCVLILRKGVGSFTSLLGMMLLACAFCLTFAITSISPLTFAEPLRVRYFLPLMMTAYLATPLMLYNVAGVRKPLFIGISLIMILVNFPSILNYRNTNAFTVNKFAEQVDQYYRNGTWLLFTDGRVARLMRAVYLSDQVLFEENKGELPKVGKTYSSFFMEEKFHIPLLSSIVRAPRENEYVFLTHHNEFKKPTAFLPPKDR